MKKISKTPRTDAALDATLNPDYQYVGAETEAWAFARKLELELNELKALTESWAFVTLTELQSFVELVATPKRPDGTYNYCREALEKLAKELL